MKKRVKSYTISAVAEMFDIHPQTLRMYEREGLLKPSRSVGNTRLYSDEDLERLEALFGPLAGAASGDDEADQSGEGSEGEGG